MSLDGKRKSKSTFKHRYDPNNVASKVEIGTAKSGEAIYLCRMNTAHTPVAGKDKYTVQYYAMTDTEEVVGKATLVLNANSSRGELEYFIAEEHRGKGIGTIMLHSIVGSAMITEEPLDNLPMVTRFGQEPETTLLKSIYLSINKDNYASQAIAIKNGFEKTDQETFEIERAKLFEQYFTSQEDKTQENNVETVAKESVPIVEMLWEDSSNTGEL